MAEIGLYALTSLLGAGFLLNQTKQARPIKAGGGLEYNDKTVGTDMYNSRDYFKVKQEEFDRATKNWTDAQSPKITGVIPMYFNTLYVKADEEKIPNANFNPDKIYGVLQYLDYDTQAKIKASSIHDRGRSTATEWGIVMDKPTPSALQEGGDPFKDIGAILPNQTDFTHNNMVPFYRRTITQDTRSTNQGKEATLELFTGQFKLNKPQKEETGPLFKPMPENIHGTQIYRDLSRYNPNNTGKKHGESPIEKIQVGPGLGQGFTNLPSGGRHETLRILPKSINELRVDPVTETEAKTSSGASQIAKRTLISQLYRNRPELLVTNLKGERNFTTTGASIAPMSQPTIVLRDTQRKKSKSLVGSAKAASASGSRVSPNSKVSTKVNHRASSFRNTAAQNQKVNDYGRSGFTAYDNNRMTAVKIKDKDTDKVKVKDKDNSCSTDGWVFGGTQTIMQLMGLAGSTQATVGIQDEVRKTRKQHYVHNERSQTGNSNGVAAQPAKAPSYNPEEWTAKKTIRETTENNDHVGIAAGPVKKRIVWEGQTAKKTIRETTENNKHKGNVGASSKNQSGGYSTSKWDAKNTSRQFTSDNSYTGTASSKNKSGSYATSKWNAKNTSRQFTSDNSYTGAANAGDKKMASYDSAYNARTNANKEVVSKGRAPTDRGPNLGHQNINVEMKKLDSDRENKYMAMKSTTAGNVFNPDAIGPCSVTSEKNHLPENETRLDVGILDAFKRNPLTQSLASWF